MEIEILCLDAQLQVEEQVRQIYGEFLGELGSDPDTFRFQGTYCFGVASIGRGLINAEALLGTINHESLHCVVDELEGRDACEGLDRLHYHIDFVYEVIDFFTIDGKEVF